MRFSELFRTALRSLLSNRKRSFLTMIGIIIGIASVITIMSLGNGVKSTIQKNLKADQSGKQTTTVSFASTGDDINVQGFNQADLQLIRSQSGLGVTNVKIKQQTENVNVSGNILGSDHNLILTASKSAPDLDMLAGHNLTSYDNTVHNQDLVLSKYLAKKIFKSVDQALGGAVVINGISYTIVGVFNDKNVGEDVYVPQSTFTGGAAQDQGNDIELTFAKGTDVNKSSQKIAKLLNQQGSHRDQGDYSYLDMGALLDGISKVIDALTYFVAAIAAISLFIAGIGVMNMMYISVSERTQEIGIRLAVGATPRAIMWQFLLESIMLTVIGGLIGFALGALFAWGISSFLPFKAAPSFANFLLAFSVSTGVGVIFGLLPAQQAAHKNLIDILR
ncbi:ABC transporter permease [Leuconostocaceae bacterium ESL0723]|nr:ABC transporter permease [Leuconostocaceae bacterium ESL0723]